MNKLSNLNFKISILLVIPFYNEEKNLPIVINCLKKCNCNLKEIGLIGVDHNSTDRSVIFFNNLTTDFGYAKIIRENFPISCVGIPRKSGLDYAYNYSKSVYLLQGKKIIIGSLDADAFVNPNFFNEAKNFLKKNFDILVFPSRHNQNYLLKIIKLQKKSIQTTAIKVLLGIEWFKFQLREFLYKIGVNETRGSSGFFITPDAYKKIGGHKQFFNKDGLPISGESNAIGIKANKLRLRVKVSKYLTEVDPRRYIQAILKNSDIQGYNKDKANAKIFIPSTRNAVIPIISKNQWLLFYNKALLGALNMVLVRAYCYQKLSYLDDLFGENIIWLKLLKNFNNYLKKNIKKEESYYVIGDGIFYDAFKFAINKIGGKEIYKLINYINSKIVNEKELIKWSTSTIYHPYLKII